MGVAKAPNGEGGKEGRKEGGGTRHANANIFGAGAEEEIGGGGGDGGFGPAGKFDEHATYIRVPASTPQFLMDF